MNLYERLEAWEEPDDEGKRMLLMKTRVSTAMTHLVIKHRSNKVVQFQLPSCHFYDIFNISICVFANNLFIKRISYSSRFVCLVNIVERLLTNVRHRANAWLQQAGVCFHAQVLLLATVRVVSAASTTSISK